MNGDRFGHFRLLQHIDDGGSADVYRAIDESSDTTVALKILKPELRTDPELGRKLLEEGNLLRQLDHPGIVSVREVGTAADAPYIAMELLAGQTLQQLLQDTGRISQRQALQIIARLAEALDYAHEQGLVHRDLKPANIMVHRDRVTLTDFGIARVSGVKTTRALATPRYMSPEQAAGNILEGRSDLFSLGAIAYEMLSGKRAFDADSLSALIEQVKSRQPPALQDNAPGLSLGTLAIVTRLLEKDPSARFARGRDVVEAINKELARPTAPAVTPANLWLRKLVIALAAAGLLVIAIWYGA